MRNLYLIGIIMFLFSCSGQKTNDAEEGTFDGIEYLDEYQGTFTNSKGEEFDFYLVVENE